MAKLTKSQRRKREKIIRALYIDWVDQRRGGLANFVAEAVNRRFLTNAPIATSTVKKSKRQKR